MTLEQNLLVYADKDLLQSVAKLIVRKLRDAKKDQDKQVVTSLTQLRNKVLVKLS